MARIDRIQLEEKEILWADRKRILGMPISFTRYSIDDERLYVKKGLLRTELDEILLYRILDVKSTQTLWQKIFGVGTLRLFSADQTNRELILKNIKKPEKLHKYLSNIIEKNRQSKGIAGREIIGMAGTGLGQGHEDDCAVMDDSGLDIAPELSDEIDCTCDDGQI